ELKPEYAEAYNNLGNAFNSLGKHEEAIATYNKAIKLRPDYAEAYSNRNLSLNYSSCWEKAFIFEQHLEFEKKFGEPDIKTPSNARFCDRPKTLLRIGYVSSDFKIHSVAHFFESLLENHTSTNVETFCYYNDTRIDKTTRRLMRYSDHWRSVVGLSDADLVQIIKDDNINILVDLAGHTSKNRLLVFAQKPAPIQITWLGYPNTTGLKAIDYRFTDIIADPIGESDKMHSEKLIRLKNTFLCYKGNKNIFTNYDPPSKSQGYITFGSFNNLAKITPAVIKVWSSILHNSPNSQLLLKSRQLRFNSKECLSHFEKEGITEDRIKLLGFLSKDDHLALYNSIDTCLDPFPFNGATTTCEALWMGVPVITLIGDRHAGRVGASLLTNLGMTNLIAQDSDDYIEKALKVSNDRDYLQRLRENIRGLMLNSSLCDGQAFATEVERVYHKIWRLHTNPLPKEVHLR
ncbi:MAG: hypothetical protein CMO38_08665, partial [Verrucomicrobiaceae bacterium]|nr:hypothetical protein [Verrucomicrobiaceae bacterium]